MNNSEFQKCEDCFYYPKCIVYCFYLDNKFCNFKPKEKEKENDNDFNQRFLD